ncbi:hypothetical protein GCM10010872_17950 [Dyella flava]|nr:hypothetical protein GCM10010872_17950 [Dyella flava]
MPRFPIIPIDADFKTVAPLYHAPVADASQAQPAQSDGLIQQLQAVLLAARACFLDGAVAGSAEP